MKGLIIKDPFISYILDGKKAWELRGSNTKIRGKIYLIKSGSKTIVGECDLIDSIQLDDKIFQENRNKHQSQMKSLKESPYKNNFAWVLKNPIKYITPKPYNYPKGAIIWVNLD